MKSIGNSCDNKVLILRLLPLRIFPALLLIYMPYMLMGQNVRIDTNAYVINYATCDWWMSNTDTIHFSSELSHMEDRYFLKYVTSQGSTYYYQFNLNDTADCSFSIDGINQAIRYIDKTQFVLNNKRFIVYKYESGYNYDDGRGIHFWTPEFGLFFSMSDTWCNYMKLHILSNKEKVREVNHLIEMLLLNYKFLY